MATDASYRLNLYARALAADMRATLPDNLSTDLTQQTEQILRDLLRQRHNPIVDPPEDNMGTVTKSIGTSSRDYSTVTSWESDLDNGGVYSAADDAVGECYNDSVFDEAVTINGGGTVGLASVTLSVAVGERHDGTAATGARVVRTGAGSLQTNMSIAFDLLWLEVDYNGNSASGSNGVYLRPRSSGDMTARQIIVHGSSGPGNPENGMQVAAPTGTQTTSVLNCVVYDIESVYAGAGRPLYGINVVSTASVNVANCTVHDVVSTGGTNDASGVNCQDDADQTYRNIMATGTSATGTAADFSPSSFSLATVSNNLSSDATASGTGSLTSKSASSQFVSTASGFEDLHLKAGADAINAGTDLGTTPTGVNFDIDNRDRDSEADVWDIGADEYVSAAGVQVFAYHYNHNVGNNL